MQLSPEFRSAPLNRCDLVNCCRIWQGQIRDDLSLPSNSGYFFHLSRTAVLSTQKQRNLA
jgi:hypothetical protein